MLCNFKDVYQQLNNKANASDMSALIMHVRDLNRRMLAVSEPKKDSNLGKDEDSTDRSDSDVGRLSRVEDTIDRIETAVERLEAAVDACQVGK
jgi:hypothetical protein